MPILTTKLAKFPNYVRRFGVVHGIRLFIGIERDVPAKSAETASFAVPGYGAKIHLRETVSDHAVFWQCAVMEQYEIRRFPQFRRLQQTYEELDRSGQPPIIIDCGANIGLASLWFAKVFPRAKIVAIEPEAGNFELLKRNVAHLGERVTALNGGIWPESGWLKIDNTESGAAAFRVSVSDAETPGAVRAYTVDEVLSLVRQSTPLIVKLDIEGAQKTLFARNTEWAGRTHLISLELDDWLMPWKGTSRPFFACISQHAFDYVLGGESIFCFRDFSADTMMAIGPDAPAI